MAPQLLCRVIPLRGSLFHIKSLLPIPLLCLIAMVEDTRLLLVESDEELGQFVEEFVEDSLGFEATNVSVEEIDLNTVPDSVIENN